MRRLIVPLIILVILAVGVFLGYQYITGQQKAAANVYKTSLAQKGDLTASIGATGQVRANQSATLVWQTTGTVEQVNVKTNDLVQSGATLASLKQDSLGQNIILSQADLATSQKNLDDLLNSPLTAAQARQALDNAQKALDDYTINLPVTQATAQSALAQAQENLTTMQNRRDALSVGRASEADINAANAAYILAKKDVDDAQKVANSTAKYIETDPRRALALTKLSDAQKKRDAALATLNWYLGKPTDTDLAKADANLAQAKADLAQAQYNWNRIKDGPNSTDLAMLKAQVADATRKYQTLQSGPDPRDVSALQARIAAAQATLNLARLTAPFAGTITDLAVKPGDLATPSKTVFRIDDLSHLYVDVDVSEVDINRIQPGQKVSLSFDAISGQDYQGVVSDVSPVGAPALGVVNFTITVEVTNPDNKVRPGMTAAVNIVVEQLKDVLLVPNRAVRVVDGQRVVYVLSSGQLQTIKITLGASSDTNSEVASGDLKAGDAIVLNPPQILTPGAGGPFSR